MAQYKNLAELRRALSHNDPDTRASAYGAVMEQDLQPSDVLSDDPSDKTLEALRDAEVIPEKQEVGVPFPEYRARVLALLEQIAENTGGS